MADALPRKIILETRVEACPSCGAFRGEVTLPGKDAPVRVICRCLEGRCPKCRRRVVSTPFSSSADDVRGRVWHAPQFGASCVNCGPLFLASREAFDAEDLE